MSNPTQPGKIAAYLTIALGVAAILLPFFFGTVAVMALAAVMLASGLVGLMFARSAQREGFPASLFRPWVHIIAGAVLLIWPGLALWLVAVILGGGLILNGVLGLSALKQSAVVNPPLLKRIALWALIVLGVVLVISGASGSALLIGVLLGVALISTGLEQLRLVRAKP